MPDLRVLLGAWTTTLGQGERRPGRWLAIASASLLPSLLLLAWLGAHGALVDFFQQAVLFNFSYIEEKARTPLGTLHALVRTVREWNVTDLLTALPAVAGLLLAGRARARLPRSLAAASLVYVAMCFVSYQSWPDAILLGPAVAALLGCGLWSLLSLRLMPRAAAGCTAALVACLLVPDGKPKFSPPIDFAAQGQKFRQLAVGIPPDARVVGVSAPEFFLHTGRRNGWKWPYLWFGVDEFAAAHHAGGFAGILAELEANPPALMLVARLWTGPERAAFERWAATRYDVSTVRIFPHLRRPLRVYRPKPATPAQ